MSFSESVIIPFSLFKACQLEKMQEVKSEKGKLLDIYISCQRRLVSHSGTYDWPYSDARRFGS